MHRWSPPAGPTDLYIGFSTISPGSTSSIGEGSADFTQGKNDFGNMGYGGPMPPPGHGRHQYYFWVLALDEQVDLEAGLTMWQLLARIEPKLIGMNRLIGTFERA